MSQETLRPGCTSDTCERVGGGKDDWVGPAPFSESFGRPVGKSSSQSPAGEVPHQAGMDLHWYLRTQQWQGATWENPGILNTVMNPRGGN